MFNVTIINIKKSIFQIAIFISIIVILFVATKMIKKFSTNQILQIDLSEQIVKYRQLRQQIVEQKML